MLVTADENLLKLPGLQLLANRSDRSVPAVLVEN
jgi:hypothetical protein